MLKAVYQMTFNFPCELDEEGEADPHATGYDKVFPQIRKALEALNLGIEIEYFDFCDCEGDEEEDESEESEEGEDEVE